LRKRNCGKKERRFDDNKSEGQQQKERHAPLNQAVMLSLPKHLYHESNYLLLR